MYVRIGQRIYAVVLIARYVVLLDDDDNLSSVPITTFHPEWSAHILRGREVVSS